ncbi:MAG: tetratricopeptide repeat protein [Chloroflexi bacterium]|uniref:tetratricopeptide repeat protein n=1 Tax=Candidatus Flexifilum breve TaxID=3140694 RepID=UPI003135302E|nr:tetratricopeptide repeat protein [Chloroflexota bacterium]MBK9749847.1 tetratricopeptide repeat protein [Chloroflexota bacterium]
MLEQLQTIDDLLLKRDIKKAEVLIARLLRSEQSLQGRARMLILRARARLFSARVDDALEDLQKAQSLAPDLFETPRNLELLADTHFARFELASVGFADRADTAHALLAYEKLLTEHTTYENLGWIYYQKGRVLLTENRTIDAVKCLQQALLTPSTIAPLTAYCYERLGFVAFYEDRDPKGALAFLNKAIATYPTTEPRLWLVQVHTLRSRILREMYDYETAFEVAATAITVATAAGVEGRPGLSDALLTAAETLSHMAGRDKEIIGYLQQFAQINKRPFGIDVTWSRAQEMLGDAYFRTAQYAASITAYQNALQFNPYHPWEISLHYRMARSYYQLGEYEKAISAIKRLMQSAKTDDQDIYDYRIYYVLGNAYFALGQYAKAREAYGEALELAPPSAEHLDKVRQYYQQAGELS